MREGHGDACSSHTFGCTQAPKCDVLAPTRQSLSSCTRMLNLGDYNSPNFQTHLGNIFAAGQSNTCKLPKFYTPITLERHTPSLLSTTITSTWWSDFRVFPSCLAWIICGRVPHRLKTLQGSEEGWGILEYYLDFGHDGAPFSAGAGKCSERSWGHHGDGPVEAAEVTAWDVILLMPHDDGIHDKETSPWQPESVLLGDEWSALKVQGYGYAPIGHQVKTGTQTCSMSERINWFTYLENELHIPISNSCF